MRDALGALGPVDGTNPELNNLTVAMTIVDKDDIVFLTSDGVSDNFDPVVGKFAIPRKKNKDGVEMYPPVKPPVAPSTNGSKSLRSQAAKLRRSNSNPDRDSAHRPSSVPGLPIVSAEQRHELTLLRMEDVLTNGLGDGPEGSGLPCTSAKQLCELFVDFAAKLTSAKRRILEDPDLYNEDDDDFGQLEQRRRRKRVGDKLALVPGKLDHCSLVAYKVGFQGEFVGRRWEEAGADERKYNLKLKATLAKFENEDLNSFPGSPV